MSRVLLTTILAICIFIFVGCSSSDVFEEDLSYADAPKTYAPVDDEDPMDTSEPEEVFVDTRSPDRSPPLSPEPPPLFLRELRDHLTDREQDFIDTVHSVGLDWQFTADQRMLRVREDWEGLQMFFLTDPPNLVHATMTVWEDRGWVYGDKYINMVFWPTRQLTEERFNLFLERENVITHDDLLLFWEFAGHIIDEADDVLSIANRMMGYVEAFQFDQSADEDDPFSTVILMEGRYGNVDYRFRLTWHDFYRRYFIYDISLIAGLEEEWRQWRIDNFW